jgi:ribosomal protein S27E
MVTVPDNSIVLTSNTNTTAVNCNISGSATVTATNGTGSYSYLWSDGTTDATANGLAAITYTVTLTDADGCEGTNMVTVPDNSIVLTSNTNTTAVNCNISGTATATATNGTGSYSYLWSDGTTDATANGLTATSYTVTVTDANGCEGTNMATVPDNSIVLTSNTNATAVNCNISGSAIVTPTNGSGSYSYLWSNGSTDGTANGLAAMNYIVTITDANGCEGTNAVTIPDNSVTITGTTNITDETCNNSNGTLSLSVVNGNGPYSYLWSNGSTDMVSTGLSANSYTVTITDTYGCTGVLATSLNNLAAPTVTSTVNDVLCYGDSTATVTIVVTNGNGGYTYLWSDTSTDSIATGLSTGVYQATITDINNCSTLHTVTVTEPSSALFTSTLVTDVSTPGGNDGAIDLTVSGGNQAQGYLFDWSNGATTEDIDSLISGMYYVTITDLNGCNVFDSVFVADGLTRINKIDPPLFINLFPNPTESNAVLQFELAQASSVQIRVIDILGHIIMSKNYNQTLSETYIINMSDYSSAVYFVHLIIDGQIFNKRLIVTRE